ncbi:MAG: hypothetical protein B6I34_08065 [Anaerolineaceae bacterium 4572_32.1]|nr:MAG: hypothetical protein B6I34_08065 [Anaerolineaceae bacterium 4572_32.1]
MELAIVSRPYVLPHRTLYHLAKRVMDIIIIVLALPLLLPLMALCALAVRLDSPGPVFFVQERAGKGGRQFRMYKFRTMHNNVDRSAHKDFMRAFVNGDIGQKDSSKNIYKPFQETQVTRVGRILRKTSLDELPQLFNVLKGDMSLVGPRPNVPWEVEEYRGWHKERLEVLPGITGLAQVQGRSGISFDRIVKYDIEYIEKQNLLMDLKVLGWTVLSVIEGKGAH